MTPYGIIISHESFEFFGYKHKPLGTGHYLAGGGGGGGGTIFGGRVTIFFVPYRGGPFFL